MDRIAPPPVIIALTADGMRLAERFLSALPAGTDIHGYRPRCGEAPVLSDFVLFDNVMDHIASVFLSGRPLIGICSSGILIRSVAPYLNSKHEDASVIAVSDDGSSVIPLLGSHHGGSDIARKVALCLDAHLGLTTAGDVRLPIQLDMPPYGYQLNAECDVKAAMAALLAGGGAACTAHAYPDMQDWLSPLPDGQQVRVSVTTAAISPAQDQLVYHPKQLVLGIGCARGYSAEAGEAFVLQQLAEAGIAHEAIAAIASVDLKADEPALLRVADVIGCPIRVFTPAELEEETARLSAPSQIVFDEIGCHGVAEAAALRLAGPAALLVVPKQKADNLTLAIADAGAPIPSLSGRKPGRVSLVGIGPGAQSWRTPEASRLISEADILIGYRLYLDLLGPLVQGKECREFALGEEELRCRVALEEAAKGQDVALICSGDAGIYAMGALVFELLDRGDAVKGVSHAARRVQVITAPGISAMQAAAARSGALLGHDFCCISLSDLLTPWEQIETRLHGAGAGDFVVAFYNPVSMRRRSQLMRAREILLSYRGPSTPVLLASNLGRPQEKLTYRTLETLDSAEVDMLTVVMVGSSQSRHINLGRADAVYTPRGYAAKSQTDATHKK